MALAFAVTLRNAMLNQITTALDTGSGAALIRIYDGTTTIIGTIEQQIQNNTSSMHGFTGDEDIQNRLRTLMGMGT